MRKYTLLFFMSLCALCLYAQGQEAAAAYSEYIRQKAVISSVPDSSAEYAAARQTLLRLFPQMYNFAAQYDSRRQPDAALPYAQAYVDIAMMPQFASLHLEKSTPYPPTTFVVAQRHYKRKDYANAAQYLKHYLNLGVTDKREMAFYFLAKSYQQMSNTQEQISVLKAALQEYPNNYNLHATYINLCMQNGWYNEAMPHLDSVLEMKKNDTLLSLRAQCLEGLKRYPEAAEAYAYLTQIKKNGLNTHQHYALNLYNSAVMAYDSDRNLSLNYLKQAEPVLKLIVASDPTSVKFNTMLAMTYLHTDQYDLLAQTNQRLVQLGANEVQAADIKQFSLLNSDMPQLAQQPQTQPLATTRPDTVTTPAAVTPPAPKYNPNGFLAFAKQYVEKEIAIWQQQDEFETSDEYRQRVTEQTRVQEAERLKDEAKQKYIDKHKKPLHISDFNIGRYDADNEVFLIHSDYGDMLLPVPRANNAAPNFKKTWKEVTVSNPVYDIADDSIVIRAIDFTTRTGITYSYNDNDDIKYAQTTFQTNFDPIDYSNLANTSRKNVNIQSNTITIGNSDVDINIPQTKTQHPEKYAFLIGNEHYGKYEVTDVPFAIHDVETMEKYCIQTLGIPQQNVKVYKDLTTAGMKGVLRKIKSTAKSRSESIDIIFYYAGHGVPDESNRSAFLLPQDLDPKHPEDGAVSIGQLYQDLGSLNARSVIVLLDACFSGATRQGNMLTSARGVAIAVRQNMPQGNMIAFSAASGAETAYAYEEKQHGMFTYFLLKALQDSKGRINMRELTDLVTQNVRQYSIDINDKEQNPTVTPSYEAKDWEKWKLK